MTSLFVVLFLMSKNHNKSPAVDTGYGLRLVDRESETDSADEWRYP